VGCFDSENHQISSAENYERPYCASQLNNNKNNALARRLFGDNVGKLTAARYRRYFSTNGAALDAFIGRKERGMGLSDRVWHYTDLFKREIELGLDVGIRNGMSASVMARELQQYCGIPTCCSDVSVTSMVTCSCQKQPSHSIRVKVYIAAAIVMPSALPSQRRIWHTGQRIICDGNEWILS